MSGSSEQLWHCIQRLTVVKTDAGLSERFDVKVGLLLCMLSLMRRDVVFLLSCCILLT